MLLKNGIIHDAVNPKPYEADISIQDGKIAAIGQGLQPGQAQEPAGALDGVHQPEDVS